MGANIGDTVALLRVAGITNRVHCVEGSPEFVDLLERNKPVLGDVLLHRTWLGEGPTAGTPVAVGGTARLSGAGSVRVETLADLAMRAQFGDVRLLKIDTDGYDLAVIRGAREWLEKQKPVVFFEYSPTDLAATGDDGHSSVDELARRGYGRILYWDNYGRFLCASSLEDLRLIQQLHSYAAGGHGAFPYYDCCVFPLDEDELAEQVTLEEERHSAASSRS